LGIDIRLPIGFVFALIGILLTVFGTASNRAIYQRSLGINVNLYWGIVLLAFGVIMAALGRRGMRKLKNG
jgi:formate hydrogenlyase subunit 3/multisubunit Na+/H+ antiporter MnhD subunit